MMMQPKDTISTSSDVLTPLQAEEVEKQKNQRRAKSIVQKYNKIFQDLDGLSGRRRICSMARRATLLGVVATPVLCIIFGYNIVACTLIGAIAYMMVHYFSNRIEKSRTLKEALPFRKEKITKAIPYATYNPRVKTQFVKERITAEDDESSVPAIASQIAQMIVHGGPHEGVINNEASDYLNDPNGFFESKEELADTLESCYPSVESYAKSNKNINHVKVYMHYITICHKLLLDRLKKFKAGIYKDKNDGVIGQDDPDAYETEYIYQ